MDEKLREDVDAILEAGDLFLKPPDDLAEFIDSGAVKTSRTDQILALFTAKCETCADGFISTHEKATNEVRKAVAEEIFNEIETTLSIQTTDGGIFIQGYFAGEKWQALKYKYLGKPSGKIKE